MSFLVVWVYDPGMEPLLCMDETFFIGQYKGQLFKAIGVDGDNRVMCVAFTFMESENKNSLVQFLKLVKRAIVGEREKFVSFMIDMHVCYMLLTSCRMEKMRTSNGPTYTIIGA